MKVCRLSSTVGLDEIEVWITFERVLDCRTPDYAVNFGKLPAGSVLLPYSIAPDECQWLAVLYTRPEAYHNLRPSRAMDLARSRASSASRPSQESFLSENQSIESRLRLIVNRSRGGWSER